MPEEEIRTKRSNKKIALIVQAVKLLNDEPGLDRAAYVAETLVNAGYQVDLITSTFQHWEKKHRDIESDVFDGKPYNVVFLEEPGYKKNIDLRRIGSHAVLKDSLEFHLYHSIGEYDAVWCQIPPNNLAAAAGKFAQYENIPFVVDVNDLWPEAMKMAFNVPILSDIIFSPFTKDAKKVYHAASAVVGTSREYTAYPDEFRTHPLPDGRKYTVHVGNDLETFDAGAARNKVSKPQDEFWVAYAGTLGKSYDIETLVKAFNAACKKAEKDDKINTKLQLKIMGDGPDRDRLEELVSSCTSRDAIEFLGYMPYDKMAGYLVASDVTVNSLVKNAPQSIVSKIGDYLASAHPMINTGKSPEMCSLVTSSEIGCNVEPEDESALTEAILKLVRQADHYKGMGQRARELAEREFDRKRIYRQIVELMDKLLIAS